jgi:hypothetical protein
MSKWRKFSNVFEGNTSKTGQDYKLNEIQSETYTIRDKPSQSFGKLKTREEGILLRDLKPNVEFEKYK